MKRLKQEKDSGENYNSVEREYRRVNNQVRQQTRNAVKLKEREIATHVKDNPKIFWKYVTSKTRTKSRIGDLYKNEQSLSKGTSDKEKADILSEQFASVFVQEPEGELSQVTTRNAPKLSNIKITKDKI